MSDRTRKEHLQWCKDRSLELLNKGEIAEGIASFSSDMMKHPETRTTMLELNGLLVAAMMTNSQLKCIECVEGFE